MSVFELQTDDSISAFDGGFSPEPLSVNPDPDTFDQNGPNRFTVWIPSEHVVLNMGNVVRSASGLELVPGKVVNTEDETAQVEIDAGFVAQTDQHIHSPHVRSNHERHVPEPRQPRLP